eukprot:2724865-Pyramimonas_sp.AAC.1
MLRGTLASPLRTPVQTSPLGSAPSSASSIPASSTPPSPQPQARQGTPPVVKVYDEKRLKVAEAELHEAQLVRDAYERENQDLVEQRTQLAEEQERLMGENTALVRMLASQRASLEQWVAELDRTRGHADVLEAQLLESVSASQALQLELEATRHLKADAEAAGCPTPSAPPLAAVGPMESARSMASMADMEEAAAIAEESLGRAEAAEARAFTAELRLEELHCQLEDLNCQMEELQAQLAQVNHARFVLTGPPVPVTARVKQHPSTLPYRNECTQVDEPICCTHLRAYTQYSRHSPPVKTLAQLVHRCVRPLGLWLRVPCASNGKVAHNTPVHYGIVMTNMLRRIISMLKWTNRLVVRTSEPILSTL